MTRGLSLSLRAGATGRIGRVLLLAAALFSGGPLAASLATRALSGGGESIAWIFTCFASGAPLPDALTGRPGPANDRGIDCVLCQTLCCGAGPLAARPGTVGVAAIQTVNLPWMVADHAAPTLRPRLSNRARAPPVRLA